MRVVSDVVGKSLSNGPGRRVSIKRDGKDFVVAFQPDDVVVFRHQRAIPLRKLCCALRWEIASDTIAEAGDLASR